jgi:FkbM family methyltransferase
MTAAWSEIRSAPIDPAAALTGASRLVRRVLRRPFDGDYRLLAHLKPSPRQVFVDAGAHEGDSVEALRLYHPGTPILAFEPNPGRALQLAERFSDDPALSVYRCGLSDTEADAILAAPVRDGRLIDADASFDARRVRGWPQVRSLETRLFPLDDLELDVSVLKVAVNGLESAVLKGAHATLQRCEPLVICALDEAADNYLTQDLGWMRARFNGGRLIPGEAGPRHAIYAGPACEAALWRAGLLA